MKKACASMWGLGFIITLSFNVNNSHLILSCINANYNSTFISISFFENNITVIAITNLLILILNILLFLSLFINITKKNHDDRLHSISILKRISIIFAVYAIFHVPFCIATIAIAVFQANKTALAVFGYYTVIALTVTFIVDPILYAWRYKMCRLHMMMILCFFRKSKVEEIRKTLNDHYCSYAIQTIRRTRPSLV